MRKRPVVWIDWAYVEIEPADRLLAQNGSDV